MNLPDNGEDEDVVLKFVHTADWHLGRRFPTFDPAYRPKLTQARMNAIDTILGIAREEKANAILCAGDLFDDPNPDPQWWEPLAKKLSKHTPAIPIFLLPGNHDPLISGSVYHPDHAFRRALPAWVHVVDRDGFEYEITPEAVLYAAPCRSKAGQQDLALTLPTRAEGDSRIRVGLVHGSTFDMPGAQTNFPIAQDAAQRRGLDYLAIGDHHGYREVPPGAKPPTVYPGTPEPTSFGEKNAGMVALVLINNNRRAMIQHRKVSTWTWEEMVCRSLSELRLLRDGKDRENHAVRLTVEMKLPADEYEEAEKVLLDLKGTDAVKGRIGALQLDRSKLELDTANIEMAFDNVPEVLRVTAERLKKLEAGPQGAVAKMALRHLYRAVHNKVKP